MNSNLPQGPEGRQALVLQAWEAVSTERHLQGVLEAVSDVLLPFVPFDSVAIINFEGEKHDLYAMHIVGRPLREGESLDEFFARSRFEAKAVAARPLRQYNPQEMAAYRENPVPHECVDIFELESWYEHEFHLAAGGVRAYSTVPLVVRGKLIGVASFTRGEPVRFTEQELTTLCDVARALAVAVANTLANEQIRQLRSQLEAENTALRAALGRSAWSEEIIGDSRALRLLLDRVEQVASTDATVLITGETGTGKELIARAIHRCSPRASEPLVKVNCAATPPTLIASELFGHERGAFTGAVERRKGRFEQAHGGTLFLDEVSELPPETQILLLRVLQEREFERLGGGTTLRVDVRVVAATNRDLGEQVRLGRFRSDLFYRLNVFPAHVPPLRERREDIPALVGHFAAKYAERFKRPIKKIEEASLRHLQSYAWPGNVRELENVVESAVILASNGVLKVPREMVAATDATPADSMDDQLRRSEMECIEAALETSRGKIAGLNGAAKRLGMAASTLEFRIKKLGIDKHRFRRGG
ncbi:MAG: sigma 54-interacting transcriptional regulator [Acidobacteriaceae bacterium]|nr:sigma 54-interacting transcriptional regulator [Acidobacteriaceae bacterium]